MSAPARRSGAPIRTLLVANRGELVVRIARTCRRLGIRCLALVPDDQRDAWWVSQEDGTVPLAGTYLDGDAIVAAAIEAGADALHPGYGFLAERAAFGETVLEQGLTWVGPPPQAMRSLGDKAGARRLAVSVGVPVVPGYDGPGQSDGELEAAAARIGFPLLVKPAAGGGGMGMHAVARPEDLAAALGVARRESAAAFGESGLVLERLLERPRHVEVQVLVDTHGAAIHLGERDCSLQRRRQKVIEEAPAPGIDDDLRSRLGEAAIALARAAGYVGAGTAEFLVEDDLSFAFLEFNARLQVEHPVTELVTGLDLVELQLRIAAGEALQVGQDEIRLAGHAIEARVYAEDPRHGLAPSTGRIAAVRWPDLPGVRIDSGIGQGDEIGTRYDPLLAKVIGHGSTREEALRRLGEALRATRTIGVTTNRGWLQELLAAPEVVEGRVRTDTIERRQAMGEQGVRPIDEGHGEGLAEAEASDVDPAVWSSAAATLAARSLAVEAGAGSGRPAAVLFGARRGFRLNAAPVVAIRIDGRRRTVALDGEAGADHGADDGDEWVVDPADTSGAIVRDLDGRAVRAELALPPTVEAAVRAAHPLPAGRVHVVAPLPGIVLDVRVVEGRIVEQHEVLLILEAMKMEHGVPAPAGGRVGRVLVGVGESVQRGDLLVEID